MNISCHKEAGFSVVAAIVLIVLFSLIGAYMATLSTVSSISTMSSALAIQAWFGARSGIEWAIHEAVNRTCTCGTNCCTTGDSGLETSITGTTISFSEGGLNGYQATVNSCGETPATEGSSSYCIFNLDMTATIGSIGELNYASRRIVISVTDRNAP